MAEAQGKIRALELQLQEVNAELQSYDSERSSLKSELNLSHDKAKMISTHYEELQLEHNRLKEEVLLEEHKYKLQGVTLQEALKDLDEKQKEQADTKEAFNSLEDELKGSKKKLEELGLQLEETANQARKYEELNNQSSLHAESHLQRALKLETMLETAKITSNEMEFHANKLQEELKAAHHRLEESHQLEEVLKFTKIELAESSEKLDASKSLIKELELELSSMEDSISKLAKELDLYKISEDQMNQEKLMFENLNSTLKEDLQEKIKVLEEVELKLDQETKARKTIENQLHEQKIYSLGLKDQIANLISDKEILQSKLVDLNTSEDEFKAQLTETKALLNSAEQRNVDLELQISLAEQKYASAEKDIRELAEKYEVLTLLQKETEGNYAQSQFQAQKYEDKVNKLESSLNSSDLKKSELEQELTNLYKISEDQAKKEKLMFESIVSSLKEDLQVKIKACEKLELELDQETKARETVDNLLHNQEIQLQGLHEEISNFSADKKLLQNKLMDLSTSENELKEQVTKTKALLTSAEQQNIDHELQISLADQKYACAEKDIKELTEKHENLTVLLKESEENHSKLQIQVQKYQEKVSQLESSLNCSDLKKSELEQELTNLTVKCSVLEEQINASNHRSLELHDLLLLSESKVENAENIVKELELLMEALKHEKQEIEDHLKFTEKKCKDTEVEIEQQVRGGFELSAELQELKETFKCLEMELQSANDKEKELQELLNTTTEERKKHEDLSNSSGIKLLHAERLIDDLQTNLKGTREKLYSVEEDLKVSGVKENELAEKIRSTEKQLEHERKSAEESNTRHLAIQSLHDFIVKDSEQKLEAAAVNVSEKDSEVRQLCTKLNSLEEQTAFYQDQLMEMTEKLASMMLDMEASAASLTSHEKTIEELTEKLADNEVKAEQSLLAEAEKFKKELEESQLKIRELYESLSSIHTEKEAMDGQLLCYLQSITDLTNNQSESLEYQSRIEATMKETEEKLREATVKCAQRDSEAKELNEQLVALQTQLKAYKEHANEVASFAEKHEAELNKALLNIKVLEGSVEEEKRRAIIFENKHENLCQTNSSLSQKIEDYETQLNELKGLLKGITEEKDDVSLQLQSSSKANEDLLQQLNSEREKLQSEISSIINVNNRTKELHQDALEEIDRVKVQLQDIQNVHKTTESSLTSELENLKAELSQKSQLLVLISELEHKLLASDDEISSALHERNTINKMFQDTKDEFEAAKTQLQELQNVHKATESSLKADLENLKAELFHKSQLQDAITELVQQLSAADVKHMKEIEKLRQEGAEKDGLLAAKEQEHENLAEKSDFLAGKLNDLQKEYDLSQSLIDEQKESVLRIQQEREYVVVSSHDELEAEQQRSSLLEKQVEELKQKLETVNMQNKKVDDMILEDSLKGIESKSRDFEIAPKLPSKRKNKKKAGEQAPASSNEAPPAIENSGISSLKFFLGVVVVSLSIGVFLGKKY